jgi:putative heme-binding domain-containing protein
VRERLTPLLLLIFLFFPLSYRLRDRRSQSSISRGSRVYETNCAFCHGLNGDSVVNVNLRSGRLRHAASDGELGRIILAGIPGTAMPPHKLDPSDVADLIAYIHSMRRPPSTLSGGDPARGRAIVTGKSGCLTCHRIGDEGSRFASDLSDVGEVRQPAEIRESLLKPAEATHANRYIRAVDRDGKIIEGRRLNEDTFSVQLITRDDQLISLTKADMKEYAVSRVSPMPSYRDKLLPQELADVVAYLGTLKGIQ